MVTLSLGTRPQYCDMTQYKNSGRDHFWEASLQRMDLGHTVHSKPLEGKVGWHTFPEMEAVPEPVVLHRS